MILEVLYILAIQYRLVEFLLSKTQENEALIDTERVKVLAIVFGSGKLSKVGSKFTVMTVTKYAPQVILKGIPIIGGLIGFMIDYFATRAVAKFALRDFSDESNVKQTAEIAPRAVPSSRLSYSQSDFGIRAPNKRDSKSRRFLYEF